jgi:hypothetical protein
MPFAYVERPAVCKISVRVKLSCIGICSYWHIAPETFWHHGLSTSN